MSVVIIIIVSIVAFFVIGTLIATPFLIKYLMIPNAKPLTEVELQLCKQIVLKGKGYPYVCKWALRNSKCPCLPCKKLEEAKKYLNKKQ